MPKLVHEMRAFAVIVHLGSAIVSALIVTTHVLSFRADNMVTIEQARVIATSSAVVLFLVNVVAAAIQLVDDEDNPQRRD